MKGATGGHKPINAKAETVASLPSLRDAYRRRGYLLLIDSFFRMEGDRGCQSAIAVRSGEPFALAAIWETWKMPGTRSARAVRKCVPWRSRPLAKLDRVSGT